jgi:hypothetical protein
LSVSQLQPHNDIDFEDGQVPSVHIDEIMAALAEMRVPSKHWDIAKEKPKGGRYAEASLQCYQAPP